MKIKFLFILCEFHIPEPNPTTLHILSYPPSISAKGKKKSCQIERILEIEILGKKTGTTDASIPYKIQEMEKRITGLKLR